MNTVSPNNPPGSDQAGSGQKPKRPAPIAAMLLSMLFYPGTGQLLNRQYIKGLAVIVAFSALLSVMTLVIVLTVAEPLAVAGKDMATTGEVDIPQLAGIVADNAGWLLYLIAASVVLWVFSFVDAYFSGKRIQEQASLPPRPTERL